MGKKLGLQLEYKNKDMLREYDPNDKDNTTYVYFNRCLKATRLKLDKKNNRFYTADQLETYVDTLPTLTIAELKERYTVRYCYLYGKNKQYSIASGNIRGCVTGREPHPHELAKNAGNYDLRQFLLVHWYYISPSGANICPSWVDANELQFVEKKGTFTQTSNV